MKKYFLHDGINQYGPFDLAELETKIITPQTLIWYESLPEWKPAAEIEELKPLLNSKVPAAKITSPPTVSAKEEDWSKKSFYYTDDHGQQGPFTLEQLKSRPITANTPVWYDPLPEWTTAGKVAGLKEIISQPQKVSAPAAVQQKTYYFMNSANQQQGPFTLEQLKGKSITASTLIWYDSLPQWIKAGNEDSLKDVIVSTQAISSPAVTYKQDLRSYYFVDSAGQRQGPFSLEQLKGKPITASTLIWYDSLPEWIRADREENLRSIIGGGSITNAGNNKLFYYTDSNGQQGPFTLDQMRSKPINANTPVWYDPLPQWTTAGQVEALRGIISPPGL